MKKYINPTIDIVEVGLLSALCDGSGTKGGNMQGDGGDPFHNHVPARKLYV